MKKVLSGAILIALFQSAAAVAASQDECAAWICAAGGFAPSACKPPFKAMVKRIKKLKPPLPPISSCGGGAALNSIASGLGVKPSKMTYNHGMAALMPSTRRCTSWSGGKESRCNNYVTVPSHYIKGTSCIRRGGTDGDWTPHGCIKTGRYIEIFADGKQMGSTFFW